MRGPERRLRVCPPTAMARYDRLRSEGLEPADAMRQAAPMFGYPPRAHDPPCTPPPRTLTTSRPGPGRVQEPPARTSQPWKQDFPLPIDQVLAATANKDSAAPARTPPPAPAGPAARGTRTGSQP